MAVLHEPQSITSPTGVAKFGIRGIGTLSVTLVAASLTGHNATFEVSNDETNWYQILGARTNSGTVCESATGVLAATPAYGWEFGVGAWRFFRVRATAHTGGTAVYRACGVATAMEPCTSTPTTVAISGSHAVVGAAAEDAAASGNPVLVAGVVRTANLTTLVAGDVARHTVTTGAQLSVKPYGLPETDFQFTGILTTTSAVAAKTAGAAGIRNYVTDMTYQNTGATATTVLLQDGATTIAQFHAPANMALPAVVQFKTPRRGTAATALNLNCGTAAANVLVNVGGYQAP